MMRWLEENTVPDKDSLSDRDSPVRGARGQEAEKRRRLHAKKADAVIDLHGLTGGEAWNRLESFFETARREDCEKVLIVHGKGNHSSGEAVLKDLVRTFIERCPWAGESGHAGADQGGSGATWVLLKVPLR